MLELYSWNTPNGQKPLIMLEEIGLDYEAHPVDIGKGAQHEAAYRAINPNGKIPALLDRSEKGRHPDGLRLFESGAILIYLAEKTGRLLPTTASARAEALSWVFWQVGGLGPMLGQWGHFAFADEDVPYAKARYLDESIRLLTVLEVHLETDGFLAGDYTIADMMVWPWVKSGFDYIGRAHPDRLKGLDRLHAWVDRVGARDAVQRGMAAAKTLTGE